MINLYTETTAHFSSCLLPFSFQFFYILFETEEQTISEVQKFN